MTLAALRSQERWLPSLRGMRCSRAGIGGAGALLLDFGHIEPPDERGHQVAEKSLVVECPWRLETPRLVLAGYLDPDDLAESAAQACVGRSVDATAVFHPSFTARIELDGAFTIWVFPCEAEDYAEVGEYPSSPWFVTGSDVPEGWEE